MRIVAVSAHVIVEPSLEGVFDQYLVLSLSRLWPALPRSKVGLVLEAPAIRLNFTKVISIRSEAGSQCAMISPRLARKLAIERYLPGRSRLLLPVLCGEEISAWRYLALRAANDNSSLEQPKV